jgi:hypothetical protein
MEANIETDQEPREANSKNELEEMEAKDLEEYPEEIKSIAVHEEDPMEKAAVKYSGTMKKRHMGQHLAAGRRGEPKELTRGDCGSWRKLSAACRKVSRHAAVARRKGNFSRKMCTQGNCGPLKELMAAGRMMIHCARHRSKGQNKDDVAQKARKDEHSGRDVGRDQNATLA